MMNSNYEHLKIIYNRSKLGWYWAPIYVVLWFLLFYLVVPYSFYYSPDLLKIQDEGTNEGRFIGERAEQTLLKLSKIGPKVVGSQSNEEAALRILLKEIESIEQESLKNHYHIEHDLQIASGNYAIGTVIRAYQSIQNVIVRVRPKEVISENSSACLLVNSHFDSETSSPGAGDDGLMVVVMLETLRVITKHRTPIQHCIVFLFNGAEEVGLQGAHAFITQHKWAKNIGAVINLDAAGSGGREMLFRTGPATWPLQYYGSHAIFPFATTLASEVFDYGLVPSDTDFRIFRDIGNISGIDLASISNGYVYHTKYDRFNIIPRGSYQSTGENVLALTKALASAPELENPEHQSKENMVFFDFLGWFFVSYTESTGVAWNIAICIIAILTILAYIWNMAKQTGMFRQRIFTKFIILLSIQLAAICLAVGLTISIAIFMDIIGLSLSWYSQKWMIFGLYFCPIFFCLGILPAIYLGKVKEHGLPLGYAIQLTMHSHCLILCILLIALTAMRIRSAFLIMISIGFYTISVLINIATCFHNKTFLWLIPHIACQVLPFLFFTYNCYLFFEALVPISGRSGDTSNPELKIAGFTALICLLFAAFLIPIFWLFRKSKLILSTFALLCLVFIVLAATPIGFPYTERVSAQRFAVQHTIRTFHNDDPKMSVNHSDSGFYVTPFDRRTNTLKLNSNETIIRESESCSKYPLCGSPKLMKRVSSEESIWVPGPPPEPDGWPAIRILSKRSTSAKNVLYLIEITGPDRMSIYISPLDNTKLIHWSFDEKAIVRNSSTSYFIYYTYALNPKPLIFHLEFEHESSNWSGPAFDMVITGNKVHHESEFTHAFRDFLTKFSSWTVVTAWLSSYECWTL